MSRIIEVLVQAGESGALDGESAFLELPVAMRRALRLGDTAAVATLAGVEPVRCCLVASPDNEPEPAEAPAEPDSDVPESPDAAAA
ncbi:hypothetical protein [Cognatilysobacter segetis]|uniref:hypothetical protein n=1 Tax=Cognatilysobacter segetis TaxID=2492394 RepID=UPI0010602EB7|nr:hypothetical protein [Lysobacter segetis]